MDKQNPLNIASQSVLLFMLMYLAVALIFGGKYNDLFKYVENDNNLINIVGKILFVCGWIINLIAAFQYVLAYRDKKEIPGFIYKISRNPMFVAHAFFTIPGLSLLVNNWLLMTGSILLLLLAKLLLKEYVEYAASGD